MHNHPMYIEPTPEQWGHYLAAQRGGGADDYFKGIQYQRGTGALGNIFRSLFSMAKPVARQIFKTAGPTGIKTALNVAQDALEGRNIGESLKHRGTEAGVDLLDTARSRLAKPQRKIGTKRRRLKQKGRGLGNRIGYNNGRKKTINAVRRKQKRTKKRSDIFS